MESKHKINLQRYLLPKASKKYLFRIVVYIVLLSVLGGLLYYLGDEKEVESIDSVKEINHIIISVLRQAQ